MVIQCMCCGKNFEVGDDPLSGLPNGYGFVCDERPEDIFNVCSPCVSLNTEDVMLMLALFKHGYNVRFEKGGEE